MNNQIPACQGCAYSTDAVESGCLKYNAYPTQPRDQWSRLGGCSMRTHNRGDSQEQKQLKLNPLKASKRSRRQG